VKKLLFDELVYILVMFNFINNLNFLIMRKRILITALIAVSFLQISAQDAWKYLNPVPTANGLSSIWFTNEETGFIVGDFGTFLKTDNSGYTWESNDDYFSNNAHQGFVDVRFFNENEGHISGYIPLKTIDGGSTWTEIPVGDLILVPPSNSSYMTYFYDNFQTGFISGVNPSTNKVELRKTTDGGVNWTTKLELESIQFNKVQQIYFIDANVGFVVAFKKIYKTIDGGETWNEMIQTGNDCSYQKIYFRDINNGYILENIEFLAKIHVTTDGGTNWNQIAGDFPTLYDIKFFNDSCGIIASDANLLTTNDYGTTWQIGLDVTNRTLRNINLVNTNYGYLVGKGLIKASIENGVFSFEQEQHSFSTISPTYRHNQRLFGYLQDGSWGYSKNFYYSDNLGIDYLPCEGLPEDYSTYSVEFFSDSVGYACTYPGSMYKSTDAGKSWELIYTHSTQTGNNCFFLNDTLGYWSQYEGGWYSSLLKTIDGGKSWSLLGAQKYLSFTDLYFSSENIGYVMGFTDISDMIYKTVDGGETWDGGFSTNNIPEKFIPINNDTIIAVAYGNIFRTINAGENWNQVTNAHMVKPFADYNSSANFLYANGSGSNSYKYQISNDFGENWNTVTFNGIANFSPRFMYMTDANSGIAFGSGIITKGLLPLNFHVNAGGTGYCEGTEGVEIFMPKTEYIVNYTLHKDGVAQTTLLANGDTLSFGNQLAGVYTFTAENENGITNLTDTIVISEIPTIGTAGIITGDEAVCMETSNSVYSVEPVAAASEYLWTLPSGFNISTGENTNEITVSVASGAVSGPITVQASNQCGQSNTQSFDVTVSLTPTAEFSADITTTLVNETITLTDESDGATSWLWTITPSTGVSFTGGTDATSQNPQVTFANQGVYDVELKATGLCGENSELKNDYITVNILGGISETAKGNISVYPTPASTFISIETNAMDLNSRIEIINTDGQVVYKGLLDNPTKKEINIENLNSGIYVIKITNNRSSKFVKFLVQK
jgi:photosystem II stability/assembly factor-like uncharacterized protein/PKD repeat protein